MLDLSIVIINWNTRDLTLQCLQSVHQTLDSLEFEAIVVDNASTDDSVAAVRARFPRARVIENRENVGFARANNQGARASAGRYILFLNSDALLMPRAARQMFDLAESQRQAGIIGAHLLNSDGSFQASHTPFPTLWQEFLILSGLGRLLYGRWYPSRGPEDDKGPQMVDYVEGACLFVRRTAFDQVGGLDESYFMYAEEVDWCYAMKEKGWQVWYEPAARVIHLGGGSSRTRRLQREGDLYTSRVRFFRKHYGNVAATLLKWQIYFFTAVKITAHSLLRWVSGGKQGRQVVTLSDLTARLREA
jgi:N-acetylglucosaminyl-diphospho-decaprenol L-rhamnosyltransferase